MVQITSGRPRRSNCLLGGVAIADSYRMTLNEVKDQVSERIGNIPKELAIDSITPELTICSAVKVIGGKQWVRTHYYGGTIGQFRFNQF